MTPRRGQSNRAFELQEKDRVNIQMDDLSENGDDDEEEEDALKTAKRRRNSVLMDLEKWTEPIHRFLRDHKDKIWITIYLTLAAGFIAIVITACILDLERATILLVLTLVAIFFLAWDWSMERYGARIWEKLEPIRDIFNRNWFWIKWLLCVLLIVGVVCWLALDTAKQGIRPMVSFCGLICLILFMMVFSKHPFKWSWRALIFGVLLQFVFGLLILRTTSGIVALEWIGEKAETFLSFADVGSEFVFGASYADHFIIFKAMPILTFISSVISVLYHIGFMQWLIWKIGFLMAVTMGTSPTESMAAAGNIFLGQTESPLLIRPYMHQLTCSEIHAVMTGGFASIAGSILGAFIAFGVDATHLLTASIMSAPASLAVAKVFWPETETPVYATSRDLKMDKGECNNILEAASHGASSSVSLIASIVVNLISFIAIFAFVDSVLSWLGGMLDYPQLSFSLICSYVFRPLAFMLGVSWEDSAIVAELIGTKTFINEFVAYQKMSILIKNRKAGGPEYVENVKQYISVHSETIATYALCGFSNFASLGMSIGVISAMAPERRADISSCGLRSLIAGSVSCFMTACVAGMLYIPKMNCPQMLISMFNSSNTSVSTEILTCCTQLYDSVIVSELWDIEIGEGFTDASLMTCCTLTPPTHFNCSWGL
ncbi:solute carrier family 28 member 3-like [Synchiropus picturatus]